ncbi:hypothetical protein [Streptococcus dentiloxodontae]
MNKKTFLKKNWYLILLVVLSAINAVLRIIVNFDTYTLIWVIFTLALIVLLWRKAKREMNQSDNG